jgi:hypothetical protein
MVLHIKQISLSGNPSDLYSGGLTSLIAKDFGHFPQYLHENSSNHLKIYQDIFFHTRLNS